ncbi:putative leucine-rich repeat domain superfamily [Helianthus annuus]|uniref:Leucine-rich repeat domain superfamily n=1 Tax=Helianthus annuus TaxID=4232 RepID=A0A251UUJ5_HELAN|nr:putative leucine-rich repeat domain superfamily [Helianthus annuus]KAJ0571811.1 putative leucine-rich repeat domain superfamily [Helianthus annuus]KAJ0579040.1 putative leucine-rich repeat domain superfamily [Helianthus annuus]KAJ0920862.1 putative leucine-rich repeat domain superfamily [Helianthus annuus]KAJ0924456.1 putative leucine-rich repeat domain superfamily [Helianthus annuus]
MCVYLNVIDLHDNDLTGTTPAQVGSLVRFSVFDVSNNMLLGSILLSNLMWELGPMKSNGLSVVAIVGIGLGSGLVSLMLSFTVVCV